MEEALSIFSNRELAAGLWIIIGLIFLLTYKPTRTAIKPVIRAFFQRRIILMIILAIGYSVSMISLLRISGFWDVGLLKDSVYWFVGSGFVMLMNLNDASKESRFFRNIIKDNLKLIIVLEFIVVFHQFNLLTELILLPILIFFAVLQTVAETQDRYGSVKRLIDWIMTFGAIVMLVLSVIDIIVDFNSFANYSNLKSFLLPIILSITFIPFAYLLALHMNYEVLFVRLRFFLKNNENFRFAKYRILRKCGMSLSKIRSMSPKINDLYNGSTREEIEELLT